MPSACLPLTATMLMRSNSGREHGAAIHLHLGAHKTATTYIQAQLSHNAETLAERGTAYVPMRAFRSWRRSLLRRGASFSGSPQDKFDRRLRAWDPAQSATCIISDENMIGTCGDIVSSGQLYPKLAAKLGAIAAMTSGHEVRIFIAIRCYASFYAAAYCEALRYGTGTSSDLFKERLDPLSRRWPNILAEIAGLFPAAPIVVWPYESFRLSEIAVFDALAGPQTAPKLHLSGETVRPSLSQATVDRMQSLGNRLGWRVAGYLVPFVQSRAADTSPFDPWTSEEKAELQELYASDLEGIGTDGRYRMIATGDRRRSSSVTQQG